jgi:general secretion pathway protein K
MRKGSKVPSFRASKVRKKKKRGVALIMVMATLTVMTVMLAEFQLDSSSTLASAMASRDAIQAEYMAKSAVNLSRLLIATEPSMRMAIAPLFAFLKKQPPQLPVWEFADRMLAAFNDPVSAKEYGGQLGLKMAQGKNLGFATGQCREGKCASSRAACAFDADCSVGSFELVIVDEDAKINVNLGASNDIAHIRLARQLVGLMVAPQYNTLFEQKDATGNYNDRNSICQSIIDWADVDESAFSCDMAQNAPTSAGVEDAFYQLLPKSYRRKNAPFDSLEELHMVRGVSDDFWSTFGDPDPTKPEKRVLTVWGQGAVNVNSANAQTLLALVCSSAKPGTPVCSDPNQASMFLMGVTMAKGITMGAPLFGTAQDFIDTLKGKGMLGPMLTMIGMKPIEFLSESEFAKSITTESKVFSVYAVGVVKGYKRDVRVRIQTVVDFRTAPPLTGPSPIPTSGIGTGTPPDALKAALQPSTGGAILYYRID